MHPRQEVSSVAIDLFAEHDRLPADQPTPVGRCALCKGLAYRTYGQIAWQTGCLFLDALCACCDHTVRKVQPIRAGDVVAVANGAMEERFGPFRGYAICLGVVLEVNGWDVLTEVEIYFEEGLVRERHWWRPGMYSFVRRGRRM